MKRVELYSIEEINKYLTGLQYIRLSHLISPKGIFPIAWLWPIFWDIWCSGDCPDASWFKSG